MKQKDLNKQTEEEELREIRDHAVNFKKQL